MHPGSGPGTNPCQWCQGDPHGTDLSGLAVINPPGQDHWRHAAARSGSAVDHNSTAKAARNDISNRCMAGYWAFAMFGREQEGMTSFWEPRLGPSPGKLPRDPSFALATESSKRHHLSSHPLRCTLTAHTPWMLDVAEINVETSSRVLP